MTCQGSSLAQCFKTKRLFVWWYLIRAKGLAPHRWTLFLVSLPSSSSSIFQRVSAMQFEISDEAAIAFSERFYTGLAQGLPVDAALAPARLAILAASREAEFGTPVLFLRAADARLFDLPPSPAQMLPTEPDALAPAPVSPAPVPEPIPTPEPTPVRASLFRRLGGTKIVVAAVVILAVAVVAATIIHIIVHTTPQTPRLNGMYTATTDNNKNFIITISTSCDGAGKMHCACGHGRARRGCRLR